jgi:hypothetical protein
VSAPWRGGRIRIGESTPKRWNPLSPILRRVMGTNYSHIWLLIEDAFMDLDFVLETGPHGLAFVPYAEFVKKHDVKYVQDPDPSYHLEVGVRALLDKYLDTPYNVRGLFGMAWVILARWLKLKARNPLVSSQGMFCSESVAFVLVQSAVPEAALLIPASATPADVVAVLDGMKLAA